MLLVGRDLLLVRAELDVARVPSRSDSCCAVIWFAYCGLFVA